MKKIYYLIGVATLFLLASCSNAEDITDSVPEVKKYTPVVSGVFGNFVDENPSVRAGIIEDNPEYANVGERFYWHDGDQVKLVFINNTNPGATPTEVIYQASVEGDAQPSVADFVAVGEGVPAGNYTVYGLHPADGWTWDGTNYIASMGVPDPIAGASSEYIGRNLFMKAKAENVEISSEGDNNIDLSYKHLGGVIRFHIRNDFDGNYPRVGEIHLDKIDSDNALLSYFTISARLVNLDDEVLVPIESIASVPISFDEGVSALNEDFFLPILPVSGFQEGEVLRIQAFVDGQTLPSTLFSNASVEDDFLSEGFKAGFSYYIRLTNWGNPNPGGGDAAE